MMIKKEFDMDIEKRIFSGTADCRYPAFGCNCEFFTARGMLEIETLSPLPRLVSGKMPDPHRRMRNFPYKIFLITSQGFPKGAFT